MTATRHITLIACAIWLAAGAMQAEEASPMFPFVISYDAPDNASSMAHLLDAPAGKHGFVRVKDGQFVTGTGRIQFHATNLTGPANFPAHAVADKLAARLARLGINCVRLHFMDTWYVNFMPQPTQAILADDTQTQRNLDPKQLDKLDYLIAALKKRGIYVDMNLHVGRTLDERDGLENATGLPWANKGVGLFVARMIELQREYAEKLLTHVNPYTGNAYTDEPCVAMIEISNEDSLMTLYYNGFLDQMQDPYATELRRQWNDWLHRTYASDEALQTAWQWRTEPLHDEQIPDAVRGYAEHAIPLVKKGNAFPPKATRDYQRFLLDTDASYWTAMYEHVKGGLRAKPPVSGTQLGYSPPDTQARLDYVDIHGYWRHPQGGWISLTAKEPWTIANDSMVNSLANVLSIAGSRVHGKPYTISEYNHPYPNQYGAEGQPMLCIYGRLQGWDGVFQYSYNHYVDSFEPQGNPWCFFDSITRTDVLAHFPACAAIFLRGDVRESTQSIIPRVGLADYREKLIAARSVSFGIGSLQLDPRLALVHKTALSFSPDGMDPAATPKLPADQKLFVSDTGEIVWNTERPGLAYLAANTPHTKFFTGFPDGRTIHLGGVTLTIGKTRLNWATISLVSRRATGFGEGPQPANILLAATGDSGNTGRVVKSMGGNKITLTDRGTAPVLVEGIPATVTLRTDSKRIECFALDPSGTRTKSVPVESGNGNTAKITIGPDYKTVWYEIEIR